MILIVQMLGIIKKVGYLSMYKLNLLFGCLVDLYKNKRWLQNYFGLPNPYIFLCNQSYPLTLLFGGDFWSDRTWFLSNDAECDERSRE